MERVFLDANVLFSAAYRAESRLRRLWELPATVLSTSTYAFEEALRNLDCKEQRRRLADLVAPMEMRAEQPPDRLLSLSLPEKDRPILLAAISARASFLLTGDVTHFGPHFGHSVEGVLILPPKDYLAAKP